MNKPAGASRRAEEFPIRDRFTVSGLCVGDVCFACECRIVEISDEEGVTLAWCDCSFPEDHHEMEVF